MAGRVGWEVAAGLWPLRVADVVDRTTGEGTAVAMDGAVYLGDRICSVEWSKLIKNPVS